MPEMSSYNQITFRQSQFFLMTASTVLFLYVAKQHPFFSSHDGMSVDGTNGKDVFKCQMRCHMLAGDSIEDI
jgi:hypothetical protein